jgi:hypothetical protein
MILPKELKDAISKLPGLEKDKLIFRLLKKDLVLANRLLFELVAEKPVEEERETVQKKLEYLTSRTSQYYYSPGYLLMDVRAMSGLINEHVSITKDKYGEASLNLFMLNKVLEINNANILSTNYEKAQKFCISVIARIFKILIVINKLHEDYFIDFKADVERLGSLISQNIYLFNTAIMHGLDVNWLLSRSLPNDIADIHKRIRQQGFLR